MSLWIFVDTLTVHWNVWIDIVIQCHYNQWHWCWVPVGAYTVSLQPMALMLGTGRCEKKAPFPPSSMLKCQQRLHEKQSGAFFSHQLAWRRTPTLNSGGPGGGLFFCTDRSRAKSFSVKFISVLLYCDAPRRGISHAEHRCWVLIYFSLRRLPHAGKHIQIECYIVSLSGKGDRMGDRFRAGVDAKLITNWKLFEN